MLPPADPCVQGVYVRFSCAYAWWNTPIWHLFVREGSRHLSPPPPPSITFSWRLLASASPTTSRSSFKLENVPHIDVAEETSRRYTIMDIDNLLQWVKQFARCDCGKKMKISELDKKMGNATFLNARCSDCNKDFPMCSSVGGETRSTPEKEACPYDIHTRLVKATVNASSGYVGIRELGKSLNTTMISEARYTVLAKKMYKEDIEKLESVMVKTRAALHDKLSKEGNSEEDLPSTGVSSTSTMGPPHSQRH